jgi:arylsulfatase A-like enzyme
VDLLAALKRKQDRFGMFADAMAELDCVVGELLAKLDKLGIADKRS